MAAVDFRQVLAKVRAEVEKDEPSAGDVHVPTALGNARRRSRFRQALQQRRAVAEATKDPDVQRQPASKGDWSLTVPIAKTDDELRVVYGWASIIEDGGQVVTDSQGDQIATADLVKAAHGFMRESRAAGEMHARTDAGQVVESLVLTPDVQKALGVDLGKVGWFIGAHVPDDGVWKAIKDGTYRAFSIGGSGRRVAA